MRFEEGTAILNAVAEQAAIVSPAIAEHLPGNAVKQAHHLRRCRSSVTQSTGKRRLLGTFRKYAELLPRRDERTFIWFSQHYVSAYFGR